MNRIQNAVKLIPNDRPPIWFMRQAGRYLPEYQKIRKNYDFLTMIRTPELACKITLQPIQRYNMDAAIIFADIMTILDGLAIDVTFTNGPPVLSKTIRNEREIKDLFFIEPEKFHGRLKYFYSILRIVKAELPQTKTLIGFAAAPFTLASYLLEGKTSKTHAKIRALAMSDFSQFDKLLDGIAKWTIEYLNAQFSAGADIVQLFESWGDLVSDEFYCKYLLKHVHYILKNLNGPSIFFDRGASIHIKALKDLSKTQCHLSLDWRSDLKNWNGYKIQGNLDPAVLTTNPETAQRETKKILDCFGKKVGFIFNLGHGISPDGKLECVQAMVDEVFNFKAS